MRTQILYNNIDIFNGIGPTPNLSKSDEMVKYHNRWAVKSNFTLNGVVTGICSQGFSGLLANQQALIQNLSSDFKSFSITENGQTLYSAPYTTISNIKFDSSNYVREIPYSITLSAFQ
ncbi:MAG: hypothetical protein WCO84_06490, partial [bacterium]